MYVDNILIIAENLRKGTRWQNGKLTWTAEHEMEDQGKTCEDITLEVLLGAANEVMDFLKFTGESSNGENQKVPCLDTQLWAGRPTNDGKWFQGKHEKGQKTPGKDCTQVEGDVILYSFYQQPMKNRLGILRRSAMPEAMKVSTMVNEVKRRLKTTSELVSKQIFECVVQEFMDDLNAMGYTELWRAKVIKASLIGYMKVLRMEDQGKTKRNREGHMTVRMRRFKKLLGTKEWFRMDDMDLEVDFEEETRPKSKPGGRRHVQNQERKRTEAVIFVPHTPKGALRAKLIEMERSAPFTANVKYTESLGRSVFSELRRADPWAEHCQREKCYLCRTQPGKCTTQGIVYFFDCIECKVQGKQSRYYGESARTSYDRGAEHLNAVINMDPASPLVEHHLEMHQDREPSFEMKVHSQHRSALQRQATEGYLIGSFKGDHLMNRRGEWGQNLPPVLTIEDNGDMQETRIPKQTKRPKSAPSQQKCKKPKLEVIDDKKDDDHDDKGAGVNPQECNQSDKFIPRSDFPASNPLKISKVSKNTTSKSAVKGRQVLDCKVLFTKMKERQNLKESNIPINTNLNGLLNSKTKNIFPQNDNNFISTKKTKIKYKQLTFSSPVRANVNGLTIRETKMQVTTNNPLMTECYKLSLTNENSSISRLSSNQSVHRYPEEAAGKLTSQKLTSPEVNVHGVTCPTKCQIEANS